MADPAPVTVDAITNILRDWGIHAGNSVARHDLATEIAKASRPFTDTVARALHVEAREGRLAQNPSGMVATWLRDGSWVDLIADLTHAQEHIDRATPKPHAPNQESTWTPPESDERDTHRVLAIALGDRKSLDRVVQVTGKSPDVVRRIIRDHGPKVYGQRQVDAWLDPDEAERQLKHAMANMRLGRSTLRMVDDAIAEPPQPRDPLEDL